MSGVARTVTKVLAPVVSLAKTINPIVGLALTALTLYTTYKAVKEKPSEEDLIKKEEEAFDRQAKYNESLRREAEQNNRVQRGYNHLGYSLSQLNQKVQANG
jgi:membrane protein implicated in regulation of membrane protease activity